MNRYCCNCNFAICAVYAHKTSSLLITDKIIVHKEWFEWKLVFLNEPINLEVKGKKQDYIIVEHEK